MTAGATAAAAQSRLRATFERIARDRMAGLPFLNPRLQVEAFGFRAWQGPLVGALVTPWSINLVILPDPAVPAIGPATTSPPGAFRVLAGGQSQVWQFPSGAYEFHGHDEAGLGPYQQCSLFSPAEEFASQQDAREAASAALEELFRAPGARPPATPARADAPARAALAATGLSRRQLFGGARTAVPPGGSGPRSAGAPLAVVPEDRG